MYFSCPSHFCTPECQVYPSARISLLGRRLRGHLSRSLPQQLDLPYGDLYGTPENEFAFPHSQRSILSHIHCCRCSCCRMFLFLMPSFHYWILTPSQCQIYLVVACAFMATMLSSSNIADSSTAVEDPIPMIAFLPDLSEEARRLSIWLFSCIIATFPQQLVAICYRFDHANSLASKPAADTDTEAPVLTRVTAEVPWGIPFAGVRFPGAYLPKSPPRIFPKPYYITALAAWCAANLALLYISSILSESNVYLDLTYGVLVTVVAAPLMAFAIVGLAAARGELKAMWSYREKWGLSDAPSNNEASANEAGLILSKLKAVVESKSEA